MLLCVCHSHFHFKFIRLMCYICVHQFSLEYSPRIILQCNYIIYISSITGHSVTLRGVSILSCTLRVPISLVSPSNCHAMLHFQCKKHFVILFLCICHSYCQLKFTTLTCPICVHWLVQILILFFYFIVILSCTFLNFASLASQ